MECSDLCFYFCACGAAFNESRCYIANEKHRNYTVDAQAPFLHVRLKMKNKKQKTNLSWKGNNHLLFTAAPYMQATHLFDQRPDRFRSLIFF